MKKILGPWFFAGVFMMACATQAPAPREKPLNGAGPIVIAHRGASGYLPEHTIEAYEKAIDLGADFIEPDLVATKDGHLVARHENEISGTTDVAEKFPKRKRRKSIDGKEVEGWFTEDFTLKELKTLRAKERLAFRDHASDGKFLVPTFEEVVRLAKSRNVGIYPETKHPTYFQSIGLPLEERVVGVLRKHGWDSREAPVFIQSFETANLKKLRGLTKVRLVQLIEDGRARPYDFEKSGDARTYADLLTPAGLKEVATYADGIGPYKRNLIPEDPATKQLGAPTSVVRDAHAAGLVVHPWTFRSDSIYLHSAYGADPLREYGHFFALGVDGVFSDFTDHAVDARAKYQSQP